MDNTQYPITILIKPTYLKQAEMQRYYINPLYKQGVNSPIQCRALEYLTDKITVKQAKSFLNNLLPTLKQQGTQYIYCADATYFKALTSLTKADPYIGYSKPCKWTGYEHIQVIYGINYGMLLRNPEATSKLDLSLKCLSDCVNNNYQEIGKDTIKKAYYPKSLEDIQSALDCLLEYPILSCDIETFSLNFTEAHIGTIAFAVDKHQGIAFNVDYVATEDDLGAYQHNHELRKVLKRFFEKYRGKLIYHNASYDIKVLIYNLFMKHSLDYQGMLYGLHLMTRNIHDTKIIAYLALNSTTRQSYTLKDLSQEYAGNYALSEINDITKVNNHDLLQYNLIDCLSTQYLFEKYYAKMLADNQESIYQNLLLPSLKVIIQMELCGMPIDLNQVHSTQHYLEQIAENHLTAIMNSPYIQQAERQLKQHKLTKRNQELKTKQLSLDDFDYVFNANSNHHLQHLLYATIGLPIIDYTDSKQPAVGTATLEKLLNHTDKEDVKNVLNHLIGYNKVTKILSTFIPAFLKSVPKQNWHYLHGSFNIGGTISGRLSSSKPNLTNLPSGSEYGKLIKKCFKAPDGWLFVGADFQALEDKVNTLLTKDPNKEKVWIDGYDAHCFRAYYYFKDQMPDIQDTVESINSISEKYKSLRQLSKSPSFALQYSGTYKTLMNNCGFDESTAKQIEANYHKMYQVSDEWLQTKLKQCAKYGYVDVAFGLRIRTPILHQSVINSSKSLKESQAEARSVGNAISGQSYGLLTSRAFLAFMQLVWNSEYKYDILPVTQIHDAIYLMIKDDSKVIKFVNDNLIKEMQWQNLDELKHDKITLGAELDIYYPSWADTLTLKNNVSLKEIEESAYEYMQSI